MKYLFSLSIEEDYPDLRAELEDINGMCRWLDSNIRTKGVLVTARRYPGGKGFSGLARSETYSYTGFGCEIGFHSHPDGRIDLRLSDDMSYEDIVRLMAHELKHLGQFHIGKRIHGHLTLMLSSKVCEKDAYTFEDVVLELMAQRTDNH